MIIQRDNESWLIATWCHRADKCAAAHVLRLIVVWFIQWFKTLR